MIGELLVVELAGPDDSYLSALVGKHADESKHARFRYQPKGEGHVTWDIDKHPSDSTKQEQYSSSDQIHPSIPRRVEPPQRRQQHPWKHDRSNGQPGAFLIVGRVEGWKLHLNRVIVRIQEEIIVGDVLPYVEDDHYDQLEGDCYEEGQPCNF